MQKVFRCLVTLGLGTVLASSLSAAPVINEFLASNLSISPDNSDFDDYSDWIELYNPANTNASLQNYYLTDDLAEPFKWLIPANAIVPAGGYLVIRADGFDAAAGETHHWPYWPWNVNFQTRRFHTSFKLSADGEAVGLYQTEFPPVDVTLIAAGAVWKYLDSGTNPGVGWMESSFDDSSWSQGAAQLGYGDGDETTVISFGPNSNNKYPASQFRRHFAVTDPTRVGNIRLRAVIDDGAVFYLNGQEFARLRMPESAISHLDYAVGQAPVENAFEIIDLPRSFLQAGDNVLAVEVHQIAPSSSDLSFDAELIVSEITGSATLVDSVTFGPQLTDVSYGRDPNSTNGWSYFGEPTPGATNNSPAATALIPSAEVIASMASGFYTGQVSVALSGAGSVDAIRYTLDGSIPRSTSLLYSTPLPLTTNTILRARSFSAGQLPGPVLTRSYLINQPADRTLPVVSFVAEPDTFFDDEIGIYSNDTGYPYKGREVPIRMEFFEPSGGLGFAINGGVRIGGENIWRFAQKPLNVITRGKYGNDLINYQVFPGEAVGTFTRVNLRNGGDNWDTAMLRDALMNVVLRGQAVNDLASYRPCVLFLNGEYWGIHNMRKQFDPVFFANEHYFEEGSYDLVQYAHNDYGVTALTADTGSVDRYLEFQQFFNTYSMAQPTNYAALQERMNVDSFIDYVIAHDFVVNTSWSHNREFWCGHAAGSKWQWNVPDFDRGLDWTDISGSLIDDYRSSYDVFQRLDDNTNFVNRLMQRYAAHLGSTLQSNRVISILNTLSAEVDAEMPRHIARWAPEGGIQSLASRQAQLNEIKQFVTARPAVAVNQLQTQLGVIPGMANLAVYFSPSNGGNLRVAGVPMTPEFNTNMGLFKNIPVELTAEPAPGFAFVGWSNGSTNPTIAITLTGNQALTAVFQAGAETVLPSQLVGNAHLADFGVPYTVNGDLNIPAGVTLSIGPGVALRMPPGASINVAGALQVDGTSNAPVEILGRELTAWGNINFVNATGSLSYLKVRGATASKDDPVNLKAAISGYNSTLLLDHVDVEAPQPIFTRFGSTTVLNSKVKILFTGDGINIKSGAGRVEDSEFSGSPTPDTDGIDFDNVTNGIIRGNRIFAFRGFNSDAIDIGEGCIDLLVASNRIYNISDKGVSVGQASTTHVVHNLIVDCGLGMGIKDSGSTAYVDQNTFALNGVGVAVYEKNVGSGGGIAYVTNSIFSRSKDAPVTVDSLSSLAVGYSLSDTLPLNGTGNLQGDPKFTDPGAYDFSLTPASPAINAGDPAHPLDGDGSRADMGAYYLYTTNDYPYLVPNVVVVNEVMSHSHDELPDWIELRNNSAQPIDIGGWYLSDDSDVPLKYRIANGTLIPPNGYVVFYEDLNFGSGSGDPGVLIPFALSENGEVVHIYGPAEGLRPDYEEEEDFGAAATGVSFGRYYKASTRTYNFVSMAAPTPGAENSLPLVGPIVISEIMYHPPVADAEYLELANITTNLVTLFDPLTSEPWKITQGVTYVFPSAPPLTLAAGERILLVRNSTVFGQNYSPAAGTRIFQWVSGGLDNNGETLELSKPGDVDGLGNRQYVRVDRVDFTDAPPWPTGPDGSGTSLVRINQNGYGNDVANWIESQATPGTTDFDTWRLAQNLPVGQDGVNDDPDGDGIVTGLEYVLGTDATSPSAIDVDWAVIPLDDSMQISFTLPVIRANVDYFIQVATDATLTNWSSLPTTIGPGPGQGATFTTVDSQVAQNRCYRMAVILYQ